MKKTWRIDSLMLLRDILTVCLHDEDVALVQFEVVGRRLATRERARNMCFCPERGCATRYCRAKVDILTGAHHMHPF